VDEDVSAHLKSIGMDSVFYAIKSNQEVDLLNNWSQMDMNEVTEWYKQEHWDNYDKDNLRMSGKFIQRFNFKQNLAENLVCNPRS